MLNSSSSGTASQDRRSISTRLHQVVGDGPATVVFGRKPVEGDGASGSGDSRQTGHLAGCSGGLSGSIFSRPVLRNVPLLNRGESSRTVHGANPVLPLIAGIQFEFVFVTGFLYIYIGGGVFRGSVLKSGPKFAGIVLNLVADDFLSAVGGGRVPAQVNLLTSASDSREVLYRARVGLLTGLAGEAVRPRSDAVVVNREDAVPTEISGSQGVVM